MPPDFNWFEVLSFVALVVGAFLYIRSNAAKANTKETQQLATTRGERIGDLEAEIERLSQRLSLVEGQMQAIQSIKAAEIAAEVALIIHQQFRVTERDDG